MNKHLLIAESGSSKTDWAYITDNERIRFKTIGINPVFMSSEQIKVLFDIEVVPHLKFKENLQLHYYGASCSSPERTQIILDGLSDFFPNNDIFIEHDLLAAARASCGQNEGIACIIGTGSNSCQYDGSDIVKNVGGYGFILGDEGSGAYMGKLLSQVYLQNKLDKEIINSLENDYQLDRNQLIFNIYKNEQPSKFLASLAPFILQHKDLHYIINSSFDDFVLKHLYDYPKGIPIHFVGSIAYHFKVFLEKSLTKHGFEIASIADTPIEGLIKYHLNEL